VVIKRARRAKAWRVIHKAVAETTDSEGTNCAQEDTEARVPPDMRGGQTGPELPIRPVLGQAPLTVECRVLSQSGC